MIRRAAAIALVLLGCGGSPADEPTVTVSRTSDDDYGKAGIHAHCNLGLTGSRCILMHRFEAITPAQAFQIAPPGSGNFWVSVTMTDRR